MTRCGPIWPRRFRASGCGRCASSACKWKDAEGIWTGVGEISMPDGMPILWTLECADPDYYDGHVHHAFIAWLKARGWAYEQYDGATLFVVPLSYFDLSQGR